MEPISLRVMNDKLICTSDEELQTAVFHTSSSQRVSHEPEDGLEKSSIPMAPDRVIGLSINARYRKAVALFPKDFTHCPIEDIKLLYPFLVIEAKREKDAPGFRSIESQTAFPIRRFLKIQDYLRKARYINIDPLVWFFAYQGDDWRLYAATLDGNQVVGFPIIITIGY